MSEPNSGEIPNLSEEERMIAPDFDYGAFKLPENVALNFHLNPHHTAADLPDPADLEWIIKGADIIIPEFLSDAEAVEGLRKVMAGNKAAYDHLKSGLIQRQTRSYTQGLYSAFYASRAVPAVIDVPYFDPDRRMFNTTMDALDSLSDIRSTHEQRLAAAPLVLKNFQSIQKRDQKILQNLEPVIERVTQTNPKLKAKRAEAPLEVEVFYGSAHRSLLDAVLAKQAITATQGFSAAMSPESIDGDTVEVLYARYLRGLPFTFEEVELDFAYAALNNVFRTNGIIPADMSNKDFLSLFMANIQGLDITDFGKLYVQLGERLQSVMAKR